jgi:hypothetical protein
MSFKVKKKIKNTYIYVQNLVDKAIKPNQPKAKQLSSNIHKLKGMKTAKKQSHHHLKIVVLIFFF